MKIKSLFSLTIQSVDFEGEDQFIHQNSLHLQNDLSNSSFITISQCTFKNLQIQISAVGCTVTNSTVLNSRFVRSADIYVLMPSLQVAVRSSPVKITYNIEQTNFVNSSLMTDGGLVDKSSFWGTFRDENGELSPQILTSPHP